MTTRHKKKKKSYTIMFIPDDNGRTFHFRVRKNIIHSFFFFLVIFILGVAALIIKSGEIGAKLQFTYSLLKEKRDLDKENEELRKSLEKFEYLEQMTAYLRRLASTVGQKDIEAPVARVALSDKEQIFEEDSVDAIISNLRADESEVLKELGVSSASRQELYVSIPNISPVDGWITKSFIKDAKNQANSHLGVDFAAKEGTPIRATAPGIVESVVNDTYYGLFITIKHKFGFVTRYGHCMQVLVLKEDTVKRGQAIALVGNTGSSSAPHVHYEIVKDGKPVDPNRYIFDRL